MKFNEWLSNKEVRRQVIWYVIGIGFFLIPLLYAVIANDFSSKIEEMISAGVEVTGFAIIGILISSTVVFNIKIQAVEDIRDSDKDINKSFTDLYDRKTAITQDQIPKAMVYINDNNAIGQVAANESLTQKTITHKKNKLVVAQIKGKHKNIESLLAEIENLENNRMYDKKFKGLKYKDVLKNDTGLFSAEMTYRKRYIDKPTSTNWWWKLFTTPLSFLTLGGSLVSSMVLGISWQALVLFYISVSVMTAITSLIVYILVTRRVINKTYLANKNMTAYIDSMMIDIIKPPIEDIIKDEPDEDIKKDDVIENKIEEIKEKTTI